MDQAYFTEMVQKAKNHIYGGDIFQVVLSQRFETDMSGDTFMLYRALARLILHPIYFT